MESVSAAFDAEVIKEDDLGAAFPPLCVAVDSSSSSADISEPGAKMAKQADDSSPPAAAPPPAGAAPPPAAGAAPPPPSVGAAKGGSALVFAWANKGCDCPRCEKPAPAV